MNVVPIVHGIDRVALWAIGAALAASILLSRR